MNLGYILQRPEGLQVAYWSHWEVETSYWRDQHISGVVWPSSNSKTCWYPRISCALGLWQTRGARSQATK